MYSFQSLKGVNMKNIFLTGEINIGKSTIIKHFVDQININKEDIGGFYTKAYVENDKVKGFFIEPVNLNFKNVDIKDRMIGYIADGIRRDGIKATFDGLGVTILDFCMKYPSKLIVMDELGFFESYAYTFQKKVHDVLSSNIGVLGVIKPFSTPFMDSIRNRKDVIEVAVTRENRDIIPKELVDKFSLQLCSHKI